MDTNFLLELLGYLASLVVLISLLMSSIVKLRWINLVGAAMFSAYGFLIGALPVGVVNFAIALIDVYYLIKIYSKKEFFKTLSIQQGNKYMKEFITFHEAEIKKMFPSFNFQPDKHDVCLFILRNMAVAGLFIARQYDKESLLVELDYVIPEYRDLKPGKHLYNQQTHLFTKLGYKSLCSYSHNKFHERYLKKMGFSEVEKGKITLLVKNI